MTQTIGKAATEANGGNTLEKVTTKLVVEEAKVKLTFPLDVRKEVWLRRKTKTTALPGLDPDEIRMKVGSSFKGSSINRGLTVTEERKLLPDLIDTNPSNPDWSQASTEFWKNISKEVPPLGTDGKGGIKLEVGLRYENKEAYDADMVKIANSDGVIVDCAGYPINVSDYVLWRYCLVYNRVANDLAQVNASPNIDFYLYTKDKETQDKKAILNQKRQASHIYSTNIGDRTWVDYMLHVLVASDNTSRILLKDVILLSADEKDILLDEYMGKNPAKFIALGNDKTLELRSFIELAISTGKLSRIPNTNTVIHEGVTIGNSIEESVNFLNNPKNKYVYDQLKAQILISPTT